MYILQTSYIWLTEVIYVVLGNLLYDLCRDDKAFPYDSIALRDAPLLRALLGPQTLRGARATSRKAQNGLRINTSRDWVKKPVRCSRPTII
jgi:hypothetical protein